MAKKVTKKERKFDSLNHMTKVILKLRGGKIVRPPSGGVYYVVWRGVPFINLALRRATLEKFT